VFHPIPTTSPLRRRAAAWFNLALQRTGSAVAAPAADHDHHLSAYPQFSRRHNPSLSLGLIFFRPSAVPLLAFILSATLALAQEPGAGRRGTRAGGGDATTTTATATSSATSAGSASTDAKSADKKDEKEPVLSVTHHEITLGGKLLKYKATAGYMAMKDAKGEKTKANIFFVAYTKEAVPSKTGPADEPIDLAKRPLTFSFNGGPGSASIWLHMGALGPKTVAMTPKGEALPPPYKMITNESCWLDETDLVFIDPVSTGFSRAAAGEDARQFHGFNEDIASVGDFIRLYTTRNTRWSSPKFLIGESYGTTRASALSDYLQERYGFYLNGITLVSSIMNFATARFTPGNDLPYALFLPTYTAGAWYHKRLGAAHAAADLPTALRAAEKFVQEKYTPALMRGDALPAAEKAALAKELAALTGLPEAFVLQRNLRVDIFTFTSKLLEDKDRSVGRYDCRLTGIRYAPGTAGRQEFDPSYEAVYGTYVACFNDYVRRELKYESDLPYNALTGDVQPWNYSNVQNQYLNTAEMLHQAMSRNPSLKVWIANGYYDLATPYFATDYTVRQMGLDAAVRGNVSQTFYEGGHMMYMVPTELAKLKTDAAKFYDATLKSAGVR
jgi:carboxypeptidase C (cathepsin A)